MNIHTYSTHMLSACFCMCLCHTCIHDIPIGSYVHIDTHAHIDTSICEVPCRHIRTYALTCAGVCLHVCVCAILEPYPITHTHVCAHIHTHTQIKCVYMRTNGKMYGCTHTNEHARVHTQVCVYTQTCVHPNACVCVCIDKYMIAHTLMSTHPCTFRCVSKKRAKGCDLFVGWTRIKVLNFALSSRIVIYTPL